MTFQELRAKIKTPIFSRNDVIKLFPDEPENQINTQLHRIAARGGLIGLKRGVYLFSDTKIDEFVIANRLYTPSYVSLESVLNTSGIIPDITATVTSVTPITSKKFNTPVGNFTYSKIARNLFFGYQSIIDQQSGLYYEIASPEKAFLDFIYIRRMRDLSESRIDISGLDKSLLTNYLTYFPGWVRKVVEKCII
ncbi:hypothetical protein KKG63_01140 [Patescibacteria group bacterium]|nr:hypothetical protein [Patescibacteria group bacterium]